MTPGIADALALMFFFLFWGVIFLMLDFTFSHVEGLILFSWTTIIICAGIMSYITVFLSKINS